MTVKVERRTFKVREVDQFEHHVLGDDGATLAVVYAKPGFAYEGCRAAAAAIVERGLV